MRNVVFTGAAGPATATIVQRIADVLAQARLAVLAPRPIPGLAVPVHVLDLVGADLTAHLEDVDVVVHLGIVVDDQDPYLLAGGRGVHEASAVLEAAAAAGCGDVVVVSSALVLGALANNPVPLTEDAVVHPAPEFRPAVELAEIERLLSERDADGPAITVLRAAPVVADGSPGWLASELHRSLAYPIEGHDPGLQYLHASDLGDAIARVIEQRPDGVVNVAPDGALSGAQRRALETRPWLRVPDRAARFAASTRSAVRGTSGPEAVRPYLLHPWLVANDRLRALGWAPSHSNEEAYVAAFRPAPWSMIPSGRRQELLLGGVGVLAAGGLAGLGWLVRRRRR